MPSMARGLTRAGGTTVVKPCGAGLVHRHVDQRELQVGADAGEVVEPGAGHLGAAVEVDGAEQPAELDVVAGLEVELPRRADLLEHHEVVLAARRRLLRGRVGDRQHAGAVGLVGGALRGLGLLDLGRQRLGAVEQRLLLVALRGGDLLAHRLLLAPQPLELDDRAAATLVGGQRLVDHVRGQPALALRGAQPVGVVAEQPWIDHRVSVSAGRAPPHPGFAGHARDHAGHLGNWTGPVRRPSAARPPSVRRASTPPPARNPVPFTPARARIVLGAVLCLLVVGVVAVLYQVDLRQLDAVDRRPGRRAAGLDLPARRRAALPAVRRGRVRDHPDDDLHGWWPRGCWCWRGHVRAALWTVGVMLAAVADDAVPQGRRGSGSGRCGRTRSRR